MSSGQQLTEKKRKKRVKIDDVYFSREFVNYVEDNWVNDGIFV